MTEDRTPYVGENDQPQSALVLTGIAEAIRTELFAVGGVEIDGWAADKAARAALAGLRQMNDPATEDAIACAIADWLALDLPREAVRRLVGDIVYAVLKD